ncbi:MAG: class I SAM-dependent methyltransferase [Gemmataceae bacterium]
MTDPTKPPGNILLICWRQWLAERALARRGVRYRSTDRAVVAAAYAAMTEDEFEASNARQTWANWRTIPRALKGRVPARPWRALDLGCGTGTSTRVLAACAPAGSEVTGYELAPQLAEVAARRAYAPGVTVRFVCQGITEPLRDPAGEVVRAASVDVVNSSGVVGHHLDPETVRPLVAEVRRVLAPGGVAVLDDGPTLPTAALTERMRAAGFEPLGRYKCWPLATSAQVAFRAPG